MTLLADKDLKRLIYETDRPIVQNVLRPPDLDAVDAPIQAASVDLTIEHIFLPTATPVCGDEKVLRCEEHDLEVGAVVKVSTKEVIDFCGPNSKYGGLVTIPARLSRRGLFVPDIAHIDPGFQGRLQFTLFNLGRSSIMLRRGKSVATLLVFMVGDVDKGLMDRRGPQPYLGSLSSIRYLAPDPLQIEVRAQRIAEEEAAKALGAFRQSYFRTHVVPWILAATIAVAGYFGTVWGYLSKIKTDIVRVQGDVQHLDDLAPIHEQMNALREQVDRNTAGLQAVESTAALQAADGDTTARSHPRP